MIPNKIKLSLLGNKQTLKDYLLSLGFSRSALTRKFSKKELTRSLHPKEELQLSVDVINHNMISPVYVGPEIKILYKDENFVAIHKPAQINGHSLKYSDSSCLSYLRQEGFFDVLAVNGHTHERGMLYRLDAVTSGVLVFARNEDTFHAIRDQFEASAKEKTYWALIPGEIELCGKYVSYFLASGAKGSSMKVLQEPREGASRGELEILACEYLEDVKATKLTIKLISGLRHQIRAQLASLSHPILGDTFYGGKEAPRVFLHAYCYQLCLQERLFKFIDPDFY